MDDIKVTYQPDGSATVEHDGEVTHYTADEVAEMCKDYEMALTRLNRREVNETMDEQRVREIVQEETAKTAAVVATAGKTFDQVEFRRDIERAIARHRPSRDELRSAVDRALAWYGFRTVEI